MWVVSGQEMLKGSPWTGVASRLSKWYRVIKVLAKVLVAVKLFAWGADRRQDKSTCIPEHDIREGELPVTEKLLVMRAQGDSFYEDISNLQKGQARKDK